MRSILLLLVCACSSKVDLREQRATEVEAAFRASGYVIHTVVRDRVLVLRGFQRKDGQTACYASTIPLLFAFSQGPQPNELPRIDQAQLVAAGFGRIECEDGRGHVFGEALPYDTTQPIR